LTFTISADDPRTIRAIEIAAEAEHWLVGRNPAGEEVFGVPSQCEPGRYYIVTRTACDCADFRNRSEDGAKDHACKHLLAVRLHTELARAEARRQRPLSAASERRKGHLSLLPHSDAR
jgi:hypothetical protein